MHPLDTKEVVLKLERVFLLESIPPTNNLHESLQHHKL